jgi:hypothetical protein
VNEFVEECRREWRRLGVPDPIANEMAADLTADIEEAESEGGTAEDVLGNSAFDPQRFAGSWAIARGVTAPPAPSRVPRRWPALAFGLVGCAALVALAGTVLLAGRQSAAAVSVFRRSLAMPKSVRVFGPGPPFVVQRFQHVDGIAIFALMLLVIGVVSIAIAVLVWAPWRGGRIGPWEFRRSRARPGSPGT